MYPSEATCCLTPGITWRPSKDLRGRPRVCRINFSSLRAMTSPSTICIRVSFLYIHVQRIFLLLAIAYFSTTKLLIINQVKPDLISKYKDHLPFKLLLPSKFSTHLYDLLRDDDHGEGLVLREHVSEHNQPLDLWLVIQNSINHKRIKGVMPQRCGSCLRHSQEYITVTIDSLNGRNQVGKRVPWLGLVLALDILSIGCHLLNGGKG